MTVRILIQLGRRLLAALPGRWSLRSLRCRLAAAASVLVICGMAYLGMTASGYIRDYLVQRSAAAAALYINSFVEPHVQELATRGTLSESKMEALEELLSPVSMQRSIVSFSIWAGDVVVFSNQRRRIGKAFPRDEARERAWQGEVAADFEAIDGYEDEQLKMLNLPLLEIYAPVRATGTGRIIALAEIYEVASDLSREMLIDQIAAWLVVFAISLTTMLLLLSPASTDGIELNSLVRRVSELTRLRAESEHRRKKISHANLHVSEMNERVMRRFGLALHEGPAQFISLALLKFDLFDQLISKAKDLSTPNADFVEGLVEIRNALDETLRHIRVVSAALLPPDIEELAVTDTISQAVRAHEYRTGMPVRYAASRLPEQLPFPFKACLYRFVIESLGSMAADEASSPQSMYASFDGERIVLEIIGRLDDFDRTAGSLSARSALLTSLRNRVEAVGGSLKFETLPSDHFSLTAEFNFSEVNGG